MLRLIETMDKQLFYKKLKRKPKPVPPSYVKRCKVTVHVEGSPDDHNSSVDATAMSSKSDGIKKNIFIELPLNSTYEMENNAVCNVIYKEIVNDTSLNQEEQITSCNKLDNVQSNMISDSVVAENNVTSKLGDKLFITTNDLGDSKNVIAQKMSEADKNSPVNSKMIDINNDELHDKKLLENLIINVAIPSKEDETCKSIKLLTKTTKENDYTSHKVAKHDYELLKHSNKLDGNRTPFTKPFSRISKPDLEKLKASAFDKDGKLNVKKLMLRDFIYFNPPNNPMVGNNHLNKNEIDHITESSCDEETEKTVAAPQVKVNSLGKIVLDPKSLIIPSSSDKKLRNLKKSRIIQENELVDRYRLKKLRIELQNSDKFDSQYQPSFSRIWTPAETLKFYKVIEEFGLDFSLLMMEFPYRTRSQLKRKFFSEEKVRCKYIDLVMMKPNAVDFDVLEKELMRNQLQKEDKKQLIIKRKRENLNQMRLVIKKPFKKSNGSKEVNYIEPDVRSYRCINEGVAKIKRMKACIRELKSKYLEEIGENRNSSENLHKQVKQSVNNEILNESSLMFDLSIPLYKELFGKKREINFIHLIKDLYDFNLFISLISEMFQNLGKDWRVWAKEIVINKILNKTADLDCQEVRSAALKIKSIIDQQKITQKLDSCYQLFSDPFDHVDPIENNII